MPDLVHTWIGERCADARLVREVANPLGMPIAAGYDGDRTVVFYVDGDVDGLDREEVLAAMRAAVVAGPCEPVAPVRPDDLPAP